MNGLTDDVRRLVVPLAFAYDTTHSAHAEAREILRNGGTPDPVPSRDHGAEVVEMRVDPESYRYGAPPEKVPRARSRRPFHSLIEKWLGDGGWAAGRDGAASIALVEDTPVERRRIVNQWSYELGKRGWTASHVTTRFVVEEDPRTGETTRFYWWTKPDWARRYPPEEEAGLPEGTLEAMGVEDGDAE